MTAAVQGGERDEPEDYAGLIFLLEYADAAGNRSKRRITLQRISDRSGQLYATAFCHERRAVRSFRVDRMVSLTDLRDGLRNDAPLQLLQRLAGGGFAALRPSTLQRPGQSKALGRCRDGIRILMFLARCDGAYHPSERLAIAAYCRARADSERWGELEYDVEQLLEYADRQYPDKETFVACVDRVATKADTGEHLRSIAAAAHLLAAADGQLSEAERQFTEELMTAFRTAGFEFRVWLDETKTGLRASVEEFESR